MKIDFHTHSIASYDGGLREQDYVWLFKNKVLDIIAITDHNTVDFALEMQRKYPRNIIAGEEVMTSDGEIIGLFLDHLVPSGLTAEKTADIIRKRGGLVYIPHPFETRRHGLSEATLGKIMKHIDIIEVANGRTLQNRSTLATKWAHNNPHILAAASSDAHNKKGTGRTYTKVREQIGSISSSNTKKYLKHAQTIYKRPPLSAYTAPKLNRLKKALNL